MQKNNSIGIGTLLMALIIVLAVWVLLFFACVQGGTYVYENFGVGGLTYSSIALAGLFGIGYTIDKPRMK